LENYGAQNIQNLTSGDTFVETCTVEISELSMIRQRIQLMHCVLKQSITLCLVYCGKKISKCVDKVDVFNGKHCTLL